MRVALVALLLISVAGAVSRATGLRDYVDGEQTLSIADSRVMADLAKYYRLHAMCGWDRSGDWRTEWLGAC
jgi:hypothetical protein